ncbi:MAG: Gfo/Idh/MocA family oxidoreductase [Flavobacteriales bacterium]|nr:Gfo/Idh/MocA family oxidoreductase [Flavobacteriales bacterium]
MKKIKFGIVGCGRIGLRHAEHIAHYAELVAVCDANIAKAQEIGLQHGCKVYQNIDEMLSQPGLDIVSICTPNGLHASHSVAALQSGVNVLCEKPMAISVEDCEWMIQEAEKANKRLFVVKQNRYNPPIVALKEAIQSGKLGKIYSVQLNCFWNRNEDYYKSSDWKGKKDLDGGTLFTQFSHFIDLLYWLIGDVRKVFAMIENFAHEDFVEFEDTGVVAFEFSNGALGTIHYTVNSYRKNMEGSITIFAEKGTVKVGGQYLNVLEYQNMESSDLQVAETSAKANDYGSYQGSMSNHDKVIENVVDVLQGNASVTTSHLEGLKTVQIIEKIYEGAGKRVKVGML